MALKGPSILVYGGAGALGRAAVSHFAKAGWATTSVDFNANPDADHSITVPADASWQRQSDAVQHQVDASEQQFDLVFSAAGGWAGGKIGSPGLIADIESMYTMNVQSAVTASVVAASSLRPGGLLVLTGADAAAGPTPGMLSYGLAKAATHHLTESLAAEGGGLPAQCGVVAVLPATIDTPMNREFMADADFSTWTPAEAIAAEVQRWAEDSSARPASGSLVRCITAGGATTFSV